MVITKSKTAKIILFSAVFSACSVFATNTPPSSSNQNSLFSRLNPKSAKIILQVGGFNASQGQAQNIGIQGLIGDYFTVSDQHAYNALMGLGYYVKGLNKNSVSLLYGLNAFYFAPTTVQGNVTQEQMFTNLSYQYSIANYPLYFDTKALIKTSNDKYNVTFDVGIGPNFIAARNFTETSLDGGFTLPDVNLFLGQTTAAFSATVGLGIQFNNLLGRIPCELSYRFFYLGQGHFKEESNQLTNALNTGDNYANALLFSVTV
ncbi:MAG: hypothetical protein NTU49_08590 [Gammaproteobacteria bacterium]|nr:hypothetical protein [Gammaproteobacteria bacterium]